MPLLWTSECIVFFHIIEQLSRWVIWWIWRLPPIVTCNLKCQKCLATISVGARPSESEKGKDWWKYTKELLDNTFLRVNGILTSLAHMYRSMTFSQMYALIIVIDSIERLQLLDTVATPLSTALRFMWSSNYYSEFGCSLCLLLICL